MPVAPIKGKIAPRASRASMETMIINLDQVNSWRVPPFQRPVRINAKVLAIAEEIKTDGVAISGIITLGRLAKDTHTHYVVDGQHRLEAFRLSGLPEIIADIRVVTFDTMAEMADEFVQLNTAIVRMRPDDLLRGLTPSLPHVQHLMEICPYIGYDNIRRGGSSGSLVSLGSVLRCWDTSAKETPSSSNNGVSITQSASNLDEMGVNYLIRFMVIAHSAWGRDPEYYRLWGNLNMGLCMWLYRRLVIETTRRGGQRVSVLTDNQFKQALMALSANSDYLDWLPGRLLNDRDRSPALQRIKQIFARRLSEGTDKKVTLPQPPWASR